MLNARRVFLPLVFASLFIVACSGDGGKEKNTETDPTASHEPKATSDDAKKNSLKSIYYISATDNTLYSDVSFTDLKSGKEEIKLPKDDQIKINDSIIAARESSIAPGSFSYPRSFNTILGDSMPYSLTFHWTRGKEEVESLSLPVSEPVKIIKPSTNQLVSRSKDLQIKTAGAALHSGEAFIVSIYLKNDGVGEGRSVLVKFFRPGDNMVIYADEMASLKSGPAYIDIDRQYREENQSQLIISTYSSEDTDIELY